MRSVVLAVVFILQMGCSVESENGGSVPSFTCDKHSPESVMTGLAKFRGDLGSGGVHNAIDTYKKAAYHGEMTDAESDFCIGKLLYESGDLRRAEEFFTESIENQPDAPDAYFYRGILRSDLQRCAEAISDFDAVAARASASFALSIEAAKAHYNCDRFQQALTSANIAGESIGGREETFGLLLLKAKILAELERYDDALEYASEAVERMQGLGTCDRGGGFCSAPDLVEAVDVLSEIYCSRREIEAAERLYQKYKHYIYPEPERPGCIESQ